MSKKIEGIHSGDVEIGLIGCGSMGRVMAQLLLGQDARFRVTGLYDPDERSVAAAAKAFGAHAQVYPDVGTLLRNRRIQWVLIASWNDAHAAQTVAAFKAGKHVFCQKPLALSTTECLAMLRAQQRSGRQFNIGFTLRYSPHYRRIKALLDQGAIGRLVSLEFNETLDFNHGGYIMGDWRRLRAQAGSHLLEKCCHDIDLVNSMVGSRAARVASFGGLNFFKPENAHRQAAIGPCPAGPAQGRAAYQTWGGLVGINPFTSDKDIVDNQVSILEYANGVRASFHTNLNAALPERRMVLLGTEGAIRADVLTGKIEHRRIGFGTPALDASTPAQGGHGGGDAVLARELADTIRHGRPPLAGLMQGLESAITCFALDQALDTGRVVSLGPYWRRVDAVAAARTHPGP